MKTIIMAFAFCFAFECAHAQTGTKKTQTKANSVQKQNKNKQDKVRSTTTTSGRTHGRRTDSEGPEAPHSKEKPVPKDKSGKDSNKVGDSPKHN
jgi:hypothetical protein